MAISNTLDGLAQQVLRYLDQAGETGTTKDVIYDTLRRVHTARVTERKWNFMLWNTPLTITTIPGVRKYSLHQEFFRPVYFFNKSTKTTMTQATEQSLLSGLSDYPQDFNAASGVVVDWTAAPGNAYRFKFGGNSQVYAQPSTPSVLTVTGQATKTVTVRGDTVDGVQEETITVGTPGSIVFSAILNVAKGSGWTSTMTLSAGAEVLLKLLASEYSRQYKTIELLTTPVQAETIQYHFYRKPASLGSDNSVPDIPGEFAELLVYDGLIQLASYKTRITGADLQYWTNHQQRVEAALLDYDADGDAINTEAQYISYIPRD